MTLPALTVLDAPSNLGLMPPSPGKEPGVRKMPQALRKHGLVERLRAAEGGSVDAPPYSPERDHATGLRNLNAIAGYSRSLADRINRIIDGGSFPLVLGGDCSILLGATLALRRRGTFGLLYLDGHRDVLTPESTQTGGVAGLPVALATGHGPDLLSNLGGLRPLLREQDVVLFGYRDEAEDGGPLWPVISKSSMARFNLDRVRRMGARQAAASAIEHLRNAGIDGFWIHLDVDVLDDAIMPAVDSPQPDGLSFSELGDVLDAALSSGMAVGMQLTIFDPDLDPNGTIATHFVDHLTEIFQPHILKGS